MNPSEFDASLIEAEATAAVAWLQAQGVTRLVADSRLLALETQEPSRQGQKSQGQGHTAFLAWPGAAVDARQFVPSAFERGAVAALVELEAGSTASVQEGVPAQPSTLAAQHPVRGVKHLKRASGVIASLLYQQPSHALKLIAITGTNGKTSISWWLAQALGALPAPYTERCGLVGTLGIGTPHALHHQGLTTPDPALLQEQLRTFVDQGFGAVALEASSIGLAEGRLNGTRLHTAVFTNFTQDHLDYHGTMQAYWQAKEALFDWRDLKAAVVNTDDPQGLVLQDHLMQRQQGDSTAASLELWSYGTEHHPRLQAIAIEVTERGLTFQVREGDEVVPVQTHLIGRYNVSNLLAVIASLRSLGVPLALSCQACSAITPVPGRLEIVSSARHEPLTVIDYAHTPDALEKVLLALSEISQARGGALWCIFGCGGNRDATKRPIMGAIAHRYSDHVVVTSDNPRDETPCSIIAQILLGIGEDADVQVQVDRAAAIAQTLEQAHCQDVVLIVGKGHENYQEIAGVKHPFSDQVHARMALSRLPSAAPSPKTTQEGSAA